MVATLLPHTEEGERSYRVSPTRVALRDCSLSLSFFLPSSLFLSPANSALVRWRALCSRLGNPGGILFNIYIYIYMSNGDRPSASLVKGQERERERVCVCVCVCVRGVYGARGPETYRRTEWLSLPSLSHVESSSYIANHTDRSKERTAERCVSEC